MKRIMMISVCGMLSFFGAQAMESVDSNEKEARDLLSPIFETFIKGDSLSEKAFEAEVSEFQRRYGYFMAPDGAVNPRKTLALKIKVSELFENFLMRFEVTQKTYDVRVRRVRDVIRDTEPWAEARASEGRSSRKRVSSHARRNSKMLLLSLATLGVIGVSVWALFFNDTKKKTVPAGK